MIVGFRYNKLKVVGELFEVSTNSLVACEGPVLALRFFYTMYSVTVAFS